MVNKPIAKVIHWYDKINVAVLKLNGTLKTGTSIKIVRGENEFEDTIISMQIDHEEVKSAKKGDEVAIKLSKATKEGALIYKI